MVVGNGLIAKCFGRYVDDNKFLIFASGVSNSKSTIQPDFAREFNLLEKSILNHPTKTLIYFSTCSINDPSESNSDYITHKKGIENFIQSNHKNYLIFRVSNLGGKSPNNNTILNFLTYHIREGLNFDLWLNATRNIIGIGEFYKITDYILQKSTFSNQIVNIANPHNYSIKDIVYSIEVFYSKKAKYISVNRGGSFDIDVTDILPLFEKLNIDFDNNYLSNLLYKYYK